MFLKGLAEQCVDRVSLWQEDSLGDHCQSGQKTYKVKDSLGDEEEVMGERTALSDHQKGCQRGFGCSKCKVSVTSRHWEGSSVLWVVSTRVCGGYQSCPQ